MACNTLFALIWKNCKIVEKRKLLFLSIISVPIILAMSLSIHRAMGKVKVKKESLSRGIFCIDQGLKYSFKSTTADFLDERNVTRYDSSSNREPNEKYALLLKRTGNKSAYVYTYKTIEIFYRVPICQEIKKRKFFFRNFEKIINQQIPGNLKFIKFEYIERMMFELNKKCPLNENICKVFALVNFEGDFCSNDLNGTKVIISPLFGLKSHFSFTSDNYMDSSGWPTPFLDEKNYIIDSVRFAYLQNHLQRTMRAIYLKKSRTYHPITGYNTPFPDYRIDGISDTMEYMIQIVFTVSSLLFSGSLAKDLAEDKKSRMKIYMKLMGIGCYMQWFTLWLQYLLMMFFSYTMMILILTFPLKLYNIEDNRVQPTSPVIYAAPFDASSVLAMAIFTSGYCVSSLCYAILVSTIFTNGAKAASAVVVSCLFYAMPGIVISQNIRVISLYQKLFYSLNHEIAKSIGLKLIRTFESMGVGIRLDNYTTTPNIDYNVTLAMLGYVFLVDSALYILLAVYLDQVIPNTYGISQPYTFPFKYFLNKLKSSKFDRPDRDLVPKINKYEQGNTNNLPIAISTKNMYKVFNKPGGDDLMAVDNLNLDIYENQVTVLLGHNGAGKSTTMFILTGFMEPTSGSGKICGLDITKDISSIQRICGLCPQHNIMFDYLTVKDHITFMVMMNPGDICQEQIADILDEIGLSDKYNTQAMYLSGGQKRKLNTVLAIVAGSKIVILDEPTSGLDPEGRRLVWDIIKKHCFEKTVLLSTHYMDEAEFLGDRIAIMSHGKIQCSGTSMFLKNKFNSGYKITISKGDGCDEDLVLKFISGYVKEAIIDSSIGRQMIIKLPGSNITRVFPDLFQDLDKRQAELSVLNYGVAHTTMEDVFIMSNAMNNKEIIKKNTCMKQNSNKGRNKNLNFTQLRSLLRKKFAHSNQRLWTILAMTSLPALLFILCSVVTYRSSGQSSHNRPMNFNRLQGVGIIFIGGDLRRVKESIKIFKSMGIETKKISRKMIENNLKFTEFILEYASSDINKYIFNFLGAIRFDNLNSSYFFNPMVRYSLPVIADVVETVLGRMEAGNVSQQNHILKNYSLPIEFEPLIRKKFISGSSDEWYFSNVIILIVSTVFPLVSTWSSIFPADERISGLKLMQTISGLNNLIYWISDFLVDFVILSYMGGALLMSMYAFDQTMMLSEATVVIFETYIITSILSMFVFSYIFKSVGNTFIWVACINIVTGSIIPMTLEQIDNQLVNDVAAALNPNINLHFSMIRLQQLFIGKMYCPLPEEFYCNDKNDFCCVELCKDMQSCVYRGTWSMDRGISYYLVAMASNAAVFLFIIYWLENSTRSFFEILGLSYEAYSSTPPADRDVKDENVFVTQLNEEQISKFAIVTKKLIKVYSDSKNTKQFNAVDGISVAIPYGECFGLLGINGAGKSTTFGMLTGCVTISGGYAKVAGYNVAKDIKKVYRQIGYCPQNDILFEYLTCRKTLRYYCEIGGVPLEDIDDEVDTLLSNTLLSEYENTLSGQLSGGNKRKLMTAISMVGDPKIVFLDEPTCGMDPVSRKHSWDMLSGLIKSAKTIVLTSHSMEECEALCERLVIMVNGSFRCIGTAQYLKDKYGQYYTMRIEISSGELTNACNEYLTKNIPNIKFISQLHSIINYEIPKNQSLTWSVLFKHMETMKSNKDFHIEDYSLSQPNLEQIFLNFAEEKIATQVRNMV